MDETLEVQSLEGSMHVQDVGAVARSWIQQPNSDSSELMCLTMRSTSTLLMDGVAGTRALKRMTLDSRLERVLSTIWSLSSGAFEGSWSSLFGKRIEVPEHIYQMKGSSQSTNVARTTRSVHMTK